VRLRRDFFHCACVCDFQLVRGSESAETKEGETAMRHAWKTVTVDVDVGDIISDIDTEELIEELNTRRDAIAGFTTTGAELLYEVRRQLLAGKANAALALIEQLLARPRAHIAERYEKAKAARDQDTGRPLIP